MLLAIFRYSFKYVGTFKMQLGITTSEKTRTFEERRNRQDLIELLNIFK